MKKYIFIPVIVCLIINLCGCAHTIPDEGYMLIRIHIRAQSNSAEDQAVKLKVRDAVTEYLESELDVGDFRSAYDGIEKRLDEIKSLSDGVLESEGFGYRTEARMTNEMFPARSYGGIVVESGYYDALIIELGSGEGDNWWCVIYPPLCFLEAEACSGVQFRSKIAELWNKYFD